MFDIYFVAFLLIFTVSCFLEIIVFNEEILLALCFFSFIFFCFNTLSDSVLSSFDDRASKFEADLLVSFSLSKSTLVTNFETFFQLRGFHTKFKILLSSILVFLTLSKQYSAFKLTSSIYSASFAKLAELVLIDTKLTAAFQKNCISVLLYPLVFKTTKANNFLITAPAATSLSSTANVSTLKMLSL